MSTTTTARAAGFGDLFELLKAQRAQRHDIVVPAPFIRADGASGTLTVEGDEPARELAGMSETGEPVYDDTPYRYSVTDVAEETISGKLGIPRAYLRRMRVEHPELWETNVNGWLTHESNGSAKFLLRTLRDRDGAEGVVRALLSNGYRAIENLDVLVAAFDGIREAGVNVTVGRCDLTDRKMYVNVHSPDVAVDAARLLEGYRGPWHQEALSAHRLLTPEQMAAEKAEKGAHHMYAPGTEPIVFGGLELSNSDIGMGSFTLRGKLLVQRCTNGLTIDAGKLRKVHIGQRLDEGAIDWSTKTNEAMLELIKQQTRDAVRTFLSPDWVAAQVADMEERAGVAILTPDQTIKQVTKALSYSDSVAESVLSHFIAGGQLTAGGVMQAVTSVAQTVPDGDDAAAMEADALRALDLAVQYAA